MTADDSFHIRKLALIGVGLIGGSLAMALREQKVIGEVVGVGRSIENLQLAKSMGVVDSYTHHVAEAAKDADMIVIATPVGTFEQILSDLLPVLAPDAIVTDVGSIKGEIIRSAIELMGDRVQQFVPAHPIAGGEKSGVQAAFSHLFVDHNTIITPLVQTSAVSKARIEQMWRLVGARVVDMPISAHDQVLGVTSHLPHIIVYALINYLAKQEDQETHYQFAAGGLYDLTRIASSDAVMWRDICMSNKEKIVPIVREYADELLQVAAQIEAGQADDIEQRFNQAKRTRSNLADYRKSH